MYTAPLPFSQEYYLSFQPVRAVSPATPQPGGLYPFQPPRPISNVNRTAVVRPPGKATEFCADRQKALAYSLAGRFCDVTLDPNLKRKGKPAWNTDPKIIQAVLGEVYRHHVEPEFHAAVREIAQQKGVSASDTLDLINGAFAPNAVMKWFKNAPRKECLDYLQTGGNTWRATPWEYRRYGMYRSMADFLAVCKAHPVMSAGVIGAVSYLGHRFPFLGAVSGTAILGWSFAFTALNEMMALRQPAMNQKKAAHCQASGENISAFLITALGYKGIYHGTADGLRAYRSSLEALRKGKDAAATRHLKAGWEAVRMEPPKRTMGYIDTFLFVSGLLDNVLLPFNWVADRLNTKQDPWR